MRRGLLPTAIVLLLLTPTAAGTPWLMPRADPTYRQSNGLAYDREAVFVPTAQTVHRFEAETGDLAWRTTIPSELRERIEDWHGRDRGGAS